MGGPPRVAELDGGWGKRAGTTGRDETFWKRRRDFLKFERGESWMRGERVVCGARGALVEKVDIIRGVWGGQEETHDE